MRRALPCLALTGLALAGLLVTTALAQDLRELERQLARAKFPEERLEALDAVAQLYEEGDHGVQVTRAVAGALEDEDFDVRARAVTLLAPAGLAGHEDRRPRPADAARPAAARARVEDTAASSSPGRSRRFSPGRWSVLHSRPCESRCTGVLAPPKHRATTPRGNSHQQKAP